MTTHRAVPGLVIAVLVVVAAASVAVTVVGLGRDVRRDVGRRSCAPTTRLRPPAGPEVAAAEVLAAWDADRAAAWAAGDVRRLADALRTRLGRGASRRGHAAPLARPRPGRRRMAHPGPVTARGPALAAHVGARRRGPCRRRHGGRGPTARRRRDHADGDAASARRPVGGRVSAWAAGISTGSMSGGPARAKPPVVEPAGKAPAGPPVVELVETPAASAPAGPEGQLTGPGRPGAPRRRRGPGTCSPRPRGLRGGR